MEVTYLGQSAFIVRSDNGSVLIDPYITENDACPVALKEVANVDAVCVTHIGYDHVGDCLTLAQDFDLPVITEPATEKYLRMNGVPADQIHKLAWGLKAFVKGLTVRGMEAHHLSSADIDGTLLTGSPLGFLISNDDASVYHLGDTSIFSDLELFGQLYEPDATLIGVGQAHIEKEDGIYRRPAELTVDEAVQVTEWIAGDRTVVPMHYQSGEKETFIETVDESDINAKIVSLEPGESLPVN